MANAAHRTEYADKTLAMNARIDRQLKIKISNIDAESSLYRRELAREEKALREELGSSKRMSLSITPSPRGRFNRRASGPLKCRTEATSEENLDARTSNLQRLELPNQASLRRRSLPDMEKLYLPTLPGSRSLTAARQADTTGKDNSKGMSRAGRRCSENVVLLSQLNTPSLSPRHSVSSLVSSLSNSTNRLQNMRDSEETFDKVRQFLQKLEMSKPRSDSEKTDDSEEIGV